MKARSNSAIKLNRRSAISLSSQLYEQLKELILSGSLKAGEQIPSTRELAGELKISRPTVTVCLEQLAKEGYVELRQGLGTFVLEQLKLQGTHFLVETAGRSTPSKKKTSAPEELRFPLSDYARFLQTQTLNDIQSATEPEISFYCWRPALDQFPLTEWARLIGRHAREADVDSLDAHFEPAGCLELREAIADLVGKYRGVSCMPDQVIVTMGLNQALEIAARLHLMAGSTAVVENPGYHLVSSLFQSQKAKLLAAPVDEQGLDVGFLQRLRQPVNLLYLTPSHQFPTGVTMPLARRLQLLDWAARNDTLLLEDDYDSEYQAVGKPTPALMSLDKTGRVIYVGTLNQLMFPALAVGYLIVPAPLAPIYVTARQLAGEQLPPFVQMAIAEFMNGGQLDRHIRKLRNLYGERRQVLIDSLIKQFGDKVTLSGTEAGVFVLASFQSRFSTKQIIERATKLGVGLTTTELFYQHLAPEGEFILGFGNLSATQIREGVRRLGRAFDLR